MNEYLVGFDLRQDPIFRQDKIGAEFIRNDFILGDNVEIPISADTLVDYENIPDTETEFLFFEEDTCGIGYYKKLKSDWCKSSVPSNYLVLMITTFEEELIIFQNNGRIDYSISDSINIMQPNEDFVSIGYDLLCREGISGLMNCGYTSEEKNDLKEYYPFINRFGLLTDIDRARELRRITNRRVSEHSPFFIAKIYIPKHKNITNGVKPKYGQ